MEREQIKTALREGVPFAIETAGGTVVTVSDERNSILRDTYIVVVDEKDDCAHVIPLAMISRLQYLNKTA